METQKGITMSEVPVPRTEIVSRLTTIEGHIKGVKKMVEEERDCTDIITQLSAVNAAMQSVAAMVLRNYATICINEQDPKKMGEKLAHAVSIWMK